MVEWLLLGGWLLFLQGVTRPRFGSFLPAHPLSVHGQSAVCNNNRRRLHAGSDDCGSHSGGRMVKAAKKTTTTFVIDCSKPCEDNIMQMDVSVKYLSGSGSGSGGGS